MATVLTKKSIQSLKKKQTGKKKVTNVTLRGMKDVMEEVDKLMDHNKLKEKKQKKTKKKIESSSEEESEVSKSSGSCESSDEPEIEEIDTSGTTSGLTSGDNDERRIQIRFLEKEIRKLKIKKDFEQAEIISQVLREIIDS